MTSDCLLSEAIALAAGDYFACALLADGEIYCWGSNYWGQLGILSWDDSWSPVLVEWLPGGGPICSESYTSRISFFLR